MTTEELKAEYFLVNVTGQLEKALFPAFDNIWCKYCFSYGRDWTIVAGIDEGITQTSVKSSSDEHDLILNFPIEISWRSTNPSGWPQIAVHAYGVDALGKDVVRGYGAVHVPMQPGRHRRRIAMFTPESSSQLMALNAWFTGKRPEFVSPKVVTTGEGREVTKVRTRGFVDLTFNVVLKNLSQQGYNTGSMSSARDADELLIQGFCNL